jgi:hypothetical protein
LARVDRARRPCFRGISGSPVGRSTCRFEVESATTPESIMSLLYMLAVSATIYCTVRSYTTYTYALIPSPSKIGIIVEHLRKFYSGYFPKNDPQIEDYVKKETQRELIGFYQECVETNRDNNNERAYWLAKTTQSIVWSLCFLLVSRILFYAIDTPKPQNVRVTMVPNEPGAIQVLEPQKRGN